MSTPKKTFTITIPGDFDLSVDELWPDGDAPENPTPEDVKALIEKDGGLLQILRDWDLLDDKAYEVKDTTLSPEDLEKLRKARERYDQNLHELLPRDTSR